MSRIPVGDITKYQSFFPSLEYALTLVRRDLGKKQRRKMISLDELGALIDGSSMNASDAFRSYRRAKAGQIRLDDYVFIKIIKFLKENGITSDFIDNLSSMYGVYKYIEKSFSSKTNRYRGTTYISNSNIDNKFWHLINSNGFSIFEIVNSDIMHFYGFIDKISEVPFRDNNIRECINNCHVVSKFFINHRSDELYGWSDRIFAIRLSSVVRIGAWACQAVGQRGLFNDFLKMSNKTFDKSIPQTVIGHSMASYHDIRWKKFVGLETKPERSMLKMAYQAAKSVDQFDPLNESSVIMLNAASDSISSGARSNDKIIDIDNETVYSLIEKADEIGAFGAYELGAALHRAELKTLSYLNDGNLESAEETLILHNKIFTESKSDNK